jgi:replicative DNA helicase
MSESNILSDPAAERAVLSGICSYQDKVYIDISEILTESCFTVDSNNIVYKCIKHIYDKNAEAAIDVASIYSAARELNLDHILSKKEEAQHLKAILDFPVQKDNVKKFAVKIKKLDIARNLYKELGNVRDKILDIDGTEPISSIFGMAEETIFGFSNSINDTDNNPILISQDLSQYINYLEENKVDQVGVSTGFPVYDKAIGGGLRRSTVNVIAARPKTGKSLLVDNMGYFISKNSNIPVLNMDTEMTKEDHIHRMLAMMTDIEIKDIETGKFAESPINKQKILEATKDLENQKIYYKSIAGKAFDEQLSIMRRWIVKHVGFRDDGYANDCVIFYDYLKLMDTQGMSQDLKEYQLLGFMMTELHNFATKYGIPIVAFIQLNRDGITKETTDTASGSDRIIWLCSNFTIFKRKSDEEIAEDGSSSGNRKLVPIISRHGGGLDDNDYINCHMTGWCAKIVEGKTKLELLGNKSSGDGFVIENEDHDQIEFS